VVPVTFLYVDENMYEKSLVRLVVTLSRFPYIETTYIIVARWEVRLQAAVEVVQRTI
jgi:hypothetical protein